MAPREEPRKSSLSLEDNHSRQVFLSRNEDKLPELERLESDFIQKLQELLLDFPQMGLKGFSISAKLSYNPREQKISTNLFSKLNQILNRRAVLNIYPAGRIYCYFCQSFGCAHSLPSSSTEVFSGYNSRGIPQYSDFHQLLLDKKEERVGELFEDKPPLLTLFMQGEELTRELLPAFQQGGSDHQIIAQLAFGYFRNHEKEKRLALCVQVVRFKKKIALNILHYKELLEQESPQPSPVNETLYLLQSLRLKLAKLPKTLSGKDKNLFEQVSRSLGKLKKDIEALNRRKTRRTWHAHLRQLQKRPISQAISDTKEARAEDFFEDEQKNSIVVRGPKNRFHVFSPSGQHITSLVLEKSSFERRLRKGRWRPIGENAERVRQRILELI